MKIQYILIALTLLCYSCNNKRNVAESRVAMTDSLEEATQQAQKPQATQTFGKELLDYPLIKDTAAFVASLKQTFKLETDFDYEKKSKQITAFEKVMLYGSDNDFFLIEYDFGDGSMASYPWKYQLLLTTNGKLAMQLMAERYEFVRIFPKENPLLLVADVSGKGNGIHMLYRVSADTLEAVYDGGELRTYDSHEDNAIYEPYELKLGVKDYNADGFNDIAFTGKIVYIQELAQDSVWVDNDYSIDNPYKKVPVTFIFLYDKKTGHFTPKADYAGKYRIYG